MNVIASISESGKILNLYEEFPNTPDYANKSPKLIAKILVHGFLKRAMENESYVFHGELYQLSGYEYLDTNREMIIERENE